MKITIFVIYSFTTLSIVIIMDKINKKSPSGWIFFIFFCELTEKKLQNMYNNSKNVEKYLTNIPLLLIKNSQ
jgi:hypothetical protein